MYQLPLSKANMGSVATLAVMQGTRWVTPGGICICRSRTASMWSRARRFWPPRASTTVANEFGGAPIRGQALSITQAIAVWSARRRLTNPMIAGRHEELSRIAKSELAVAFDKLLKAIRQRMSRSG